MGGVQPRRQDHRHRERSDKPVRLWDFATGQPIGPNLRHNGRHVTAFLADGTTLCVTTMARLPRGVNVSYPLPPELPDELERMATWVEVITGLRLDTQQGLIQVLDNAAWLERRERLMRLGGPPETGPEQRLDPILFGPDPTARAEALHGAEAVGRGRGRVRRGQACAAS